MALSSLERQAFLPSQARRVDIATGPGIAMVYARKGFRSLKDCYKTPVYKHHLCMRFMAALQAAKTVLAYTMAMPHRPQPKPNNRISARSALECGRLRPLWVPCDGRVQRHHYNSLRVK